jgi:hypothetical protein
MKVKCEPAIQDDPLPFMQARLEPDGLSRGF